MYLVSVIPIARGIALEHLSYFSKNAVKEGSVVSVPIRKKTAHGIVVSCTPASEVKTEIKGADFELKKLSSGSKRVLSSLFIKAAKEVAERHATTLGAVLYDLVPKAILSQLPDASEADENAYIPTTVRQAYVLQEPDEDRYAHYKGIIRERFARKKSVLIILPTGEDVRRCKDALEKGIEGYTYGFTSELTQKKTLGLWNKAVRDHHSVLIIGTGHCLSLPRKDFGAIIIERENARGWKGMHRPFVDARYAGERLSKALGADLIIGDSCLRIETLARHEEGEVIEFSPLSMRSLSTAEDQVIDMRQYRESEEKGFRLFSDELKALIARAKTENELIFLFAARKGLAPTTICSDCESVVSCKKCGAPVVLYGKDASRFFICNRCGTRSESDTVCSHCGSWKLKTLGIGTETVEEEIRNLFPDMTVFRMDGTTMTTRKKAEVTAHKWLSSPGSILIGTELAIPYIDRKIDCIAVVSLDSYFSIPDFRMNEKAFVMISRMRSLASKKFLLQTRTPDASTISFARKGNIIDFYREEARLRETLGFPPFRTLIKVTATGDRTKVIQDIENLKTLIPKAEVDVFPAFVSAGKNTVALSAIVRTKQEWPDLDTVRTLRSLPPSFSVNVDPETMI